MEFEDILEQVGGYGKFQRNLTIIFLIPFYIILPLLTSNLLFMVSVPEHWCHVPEVASSHLNTSEQRMVLSPMEDPSCSMYDLNDTLIMNDDEYRIWNHSDVTVPCKQGWEYSKQDYEATASTKWDLVGSYNHYPSLILTLYKVGSLVSSPIVGFVSDKYGRKLVFLCLITVTFTTELASLFVNNFVIFSILRTINGVAMPNTFTLPYILILELVAPDMRAHMNGIINTCWTLGMCVLALFVYLSRTWVHLGLLSGSAGICILFYWRYIPESPCWLVSQNKYEEAKTIMMKIGERNGKAQNETDMLMKLQTLGSSIKKKKEEEKGTSTESRFLKYPRLRRNFLILSVCWIAFMVAYGGLTYNIINLDGNIFLNFFLLAVVEFPGNFLFWILMDRCGRRWSASIGFIVIGMTSLLPLIGFRFSGLISSMLGKLLISGLFMVTDQQGSELFPTVARSFYMGTGKAIATGATLLSPYLAYLSQFGKPIPFLIISLICFIAGSLASFLPETLNENLPQTMQDAEDFGKDQPYFSWIRQKKSLGATEANGSSPP